ncbi:MAG: hypothetical protein IJ561_05470 [Ruminococcus sp.]|nr:hypothetical protein [Ruminococcus sp.]
MQIKKGRSWNAFYDDENERYFVEYGGITDYKLYEIGKEIFDKLSTDMDEGDVSSVVYGSGRKLYMSVNDRCGPPYTIVFDDDYKTLCPWADVAGGQNVWPAELTDAAVEVLASEKNNREQRRKKRALREQKKNSEEQ